MAGEVTGMSAYASALTDVYETCTQEQGVDPVAMQALHDVAAAVGDAAVAMAYARKTFAGHCAAAAAPTSTGTWRPRVPGRAAGTRALSPAARTRQETLARKARITQRARRAH